MIGSDRIGSGSIGLDWEGERESEHSFWCRRVPPTQLNAPMSLGSAVPSCAVVPQFPVVARRADCRREGSSVDERSCERRSACVRAASSARRGRGRARRARRRRTSARAPPTRRCSPSRSRSPTPATTASSPSACATRRSRPAARTSPPPPPPPPTRCATAPASLPAHEHVHERLNTLPHTCLSSRLAVAIDKTDAHECTYSTEYIIILALTRTSASNFDCCSSCSSLTFRCASFASELSPELIEAARDRGVRSARIRMRLAVVTYVINGRRVRRRAGEHVRGGVLRRGAAVRGRAEPHAVGRLQRDRRRRDQTAHVEPHVPEHRGHRDH